MISNWRSFSSASVTSTGVERLTQTDIRHAEHLSEIRRFSHVAPNGDVAEKPAIGRDKAYIDRARRRWLKVNLNVIVAPRGVELLYSVASLRSMERLTDFERNQVIDIGTIERLIGGVKW